MTIEYRCSKCSSPLSDAFSESCPNCGKSPTLEKTSSEPKTNKDVDPDRPAWGFGASIVFWIFSVMLIIFAQIPGLAAWSLWLKLSGKEMPLTISLEKNPEIVVFGILSTFLFQMITIAVSYRFVTRTSKSQFLTALGWFWPEKLGLLKTVLLTLLTFCGFAIIASLLPNKENDMQKLIESSMAARFTIGFVAVVGAPLVEEIIYRGILYSGLHKEFGKSTAITGVSFLFLLVHIPQYWGAWGGILGLGFLSLVLTVVRAYSGSLLPPYVMHLMFNFIQVSLIIAHGLGLIPKE